MAQSSLRLRRALTTLAALHRPALSTPLLLKPSSSVSSHSSQQQPSLASVVQSRRFRSLPTISLSSSKQYHLYKEGDDITPDTILFEGCDYNHWLITMEFPKNPGPTPEEMVQTYVETCAKGLNISLEEAKKIIYACSTTTYEGFQAVMTEEESKKFEALPGVVFVLPDSYIDPVNKQYGGDKYENGIITPRPPPIQQRNTGGRFRDQNRNPGRPRYSQQGGPMQNQQGGPMQYQQGGPMQYPPNSGGPMQGDGRNYRAPQNVSPQQNYQPQQNFGTAGQGGGPMPMNNTDYAPGGRGAYHADRGGPMPSYQGSYNQGQQGDRYPSQADQRNYGQSNVARDNINYTPPSHDGTYGQGAGPNYGQNWQGSGQGLTQVEQGNVEGDRRNYAPMGQTGIDQGRY
ncbi:hypothetical protein Dsin_009939 [Dipteronia sinensis]|uniref:MORF/ORRM1/DAG-like MORF domain-containing protein n=1 Tax=Dipteronia sinensis TaxID=43782 RepID=A0AAE0ASU2_9ROSI|nr:hypothetical protein Dsin_009939 [Dipteronia sinensis]